ncbi:uncharacterized protein LOC119341570 [Triticum dicoccoides]|uniref:uncharacterized protein LOC119341570 n=1 Tax=Triticum dicoccoides TaxID=85692 RepID=UPI00189158ED|nr:uncharacterized protein LOC119341570 [Triticum dicoccoides]
MVAAVAATPWERGLTLAAAARLCCSKPTARAMDLTRGLPPPSPRPRICLAICRFGAARVGLAEDDDRDLPEARARRCPAQGALRLSSSMDGDDWDPTLKPDELGELDGKVVRPAHYDSPQNKKVRLGSWLLVAAHHNQPRDDGCHQRADSKNLNNDLYSLYVTLI